MKISTRAIIALFIAAGSVLQDPAVTQMLVALVVTHPHVASLLAVVGAIATALHNPKVEAALEGGAAEKEESQ